MTDPTNPSAMDQPHNMPAAGPAGPSAMDGGIPNVTPTVDSTWVTVTTPVETPNNVDG